MKDAPSRHRRLGASFMIIDIYLAQISTDRDEAFKMNFQICNVATPNYLHFCAFLAYDSVTNLHIALDRQVKDLQTMMWRYVLHNN